MKWNVLPVRAALDPDAAAEHLDQRPADRQAEAGASELAGRRAVRLAERLEDERVLLGRDADAGIGDRKVHQRVVVVLRPSIPTVTVTPPLRVNLIALATRLIRTWRSRPWSPTSASGTCGSTSSVSCSPFSRARRTSGLSVSRSVARSANGAGSSSSRPDSIFEKSRMSSMMASSASAECCTMSRYSRCSTVSVVSSARFVMPMMPFIGVRISWLMFARN